MECLFDTSSFSLEIYKNGMAFKKWQAIDLKNCSTQMV
jgi:hypothetical protein